MSVFFHFDRNAPVFNAVLKSPEGEELATGRAQLNLEDRSIDFHSDFVPLYPLGTPMELFRLYGRREVHRFQGQVYLSDTRLMRLVKVVDEPLPNALDVCCVDIAFPGAVRLDGAGESGGWFHKKKAEPREFPAVVLAMTQTQVEILVEGEEVFPEGREMRLTVAEPPLFSDTLVSVRSAFTYGDRSSYLCRIEDEADDVARRRLAFLNEHRLTHTRIFDD